MKKIKLTETFLPLPGEELEYVWGEVIVRERVYTAREIAEMFGAPRAD